jgi:xanthine/uracil permease
MMSQGLWRSRIRFDRHELAGSFGDIGTDLPLIVGMILAAGLDSASVFIVFGIAQILTGIVYGMPMPMQPLKAMAVIVITAKGDVSPEVLCGGGLAIGLIMLVLSVSGALTLLARWIPTCVVRGVQFGLALSLAGVALKQYVPAVGATGYSTAEALTIAGIAFAILLLLRTHRRFPAGAIVIGLGALYAITVKMNVGEISNGVSVALPDVNVPEVGHVLTGLWVLALPQLPLSLSNSVIATRQTVADLFPERAVTVRRIGLTYAVANLLAPLFSGIPVCHGCGGLAGHYSLGARTGGSVILYGSLYVVIGLFFSSVFEECVQVFPLPILGVVLMFEALALMMLMRDQMSSTRHLSIGFLVAMLAFTLPQGYLAGLIIGTLVYYLAPRASRGDGQPPSPASSMHD